MKKFTGLCVLSGNIHFSTLSKQWSKHTLILRFVDHSTANTEDRLFKIRPILEKVVENIKSVYSPGQHLSIDEAMILWRGRLRKGTLENQNDSHATSVVKQLLQDYLGKGYILYVDNFYTSVSLAEYLLSEMTGMKEEAIWKRKGGVVVSKWKDKREVRMINYNAHMSGVDRADQMMSYYLKNYKMVSKNIFSSHRHLFVECFFCTKKDGEQKLFWSFATMF
nr:unnamed protein product [Callosobruchus analis]